MRQATEHFRETAMKNMETQEKMRDAAELLRQSFSRRMEKILEDAPRIMENMSSVSSKAMGGSRESIEVCERNAFHGTTNTPEGA